MKKLILIITILPLFIFAQNKGDTVVSKQSLKEYNQKISVLEIKADEGKKAIKDAEKMIEISKEYSETANNLINRWTPFITITIALFALIFALLGVMGFNNIKQNLNNQFNLEVSSLLKDKEKNFVEIIEKHSTEKKLLSISKILVLNKEGTDLNENLMKVLDKYCNNVIKENPIRDIKQYNFKNNKYDLVLLDNTNTLDSGKDWDFTSQELKDILPNIVESICKKGVAFLYFGNDQKDGRFSKTPVLNSYLHLINFSNSPSTAYSNIINLLNFRMLLKES